MNKDIENLLIELGKTLKKHWGAPTSIQFKEDGTAAGVVTEMDTWAEQEIINALGIIAPGIPAVGEESGNDEVYNHFWTLDPIDATGHYVRGNPFCTTMLSRIEKGVVQEVYINNFCTDEFFSATRGAGAYKNNVPIHVSSRDITNAYVELEANIPSGTASKLHESLDQAHIIATRTITAGYTLASVAEGKLEARIVYKPYSKLHDVAPGSLLVQEAGGTVRNIGTPADAPYDVFNLNFVAGNPSVVKALLDKNGPLGFLQ
jgi:myo-inositol-1(or 4)-monophosphatase